MTLEIDVVSHYSADNIGLWHVHWFFVVDGISMPKACRADTLPQALVTEMGLSLHVDKSTHTWVSRLRFINLIPTLLGTKKKISQKFFSPTKVVRHVIFVSS